MANPGQESRVGRGAGGGGGGGGGGVGVVTGLSGPSLLYQSGKVMNI